MHEWSIPWVEGALEVGPPSDLLVGTALDYVHGLDMTVVPGAPGSIAHGGPGAYLLSLDEVAERLAHWQERCQDYDEDPEEFQRRIREKRTANPDLETVHRSRQPGALNLVTSLSVVRGSRPGSGRPGRGTGCRWR